MGKCFDQKVVFPHVIQVIEEICKKDGEATHNAIVAALLTHERGSAAIELALRRCPEFSKEWLAGNMVDWLSQRYNSGSGSGSLSDFNSRFQRRKYLGTWAYSRRE